MDHKELLDGHAFDMNQSLTRSINKAYRNSAQGKLAEAIANVSRWRKKATIAQNKLADAIVTMQRLAMEQAVNLDRDIEKRVRIASALDSVHEQHVHDKGLPDG